MRSGRSRTPRRGARPLGRLAGSAAVLAWAVAAWTVLPGGCAPTGPANPDALPSRSGADRAAGGAAPSLHIHFLDVGQGDAVLVQTPDSRTVLLDAGPDERVVEILRERGVRSLDLFITSHNHADHIGGAPAVLAAFPVRYFMDNGVVHTTAAYRRLIGALAAADVPLLEPERRRIALGEETALEIFPPPGDPGLGHNDNSLGVRLEFGAFRAAFAGDAEPALWGHWLAAAPGMLEPVQVLKASHHGSRNGDPPEALARLRPEGVVVSAGRGNRYGHPHPEALARYGAVGACVLVTALAGTITVEARPDGLWRARTERTAGPGAPGGSRCAEAARPMDPPAFGGISLPVRAGPGAVRPRPAASSPERNPR